MQVLRFTFFLPVKRFLQNSVFFEGRTHKKHDVVDIESQSCITLSTLLTPCELFVSYDAAVYEVYSRFLAPSGILGGRSCMFATVATGRPQ